MSSEHPTPGMFAYGGFVIVLLALAAASVTILLKTPGPLTPKLQLVLAVIGMYGLAIGFFERAFVVADIDAFSGLTSHDVGRYLRANFLFATTLVLLASTGLAGSRSTEDSRVLVILGRILWIPIVVILVLYAMIHLIIIVPLSYPAWVVASALLAALNSSSEDAGIRSTGGGQTAWVRKIVLSDQLRSKAFIVGAPALLLSLIGDIVRVWPVR